MSARLRAALIAAALAAVTGQILITYLPGWRPPLIGTISVSAVGLSFLAAGIAAWVRWPASRLGLLFTITGCLWLLPGVARLPYPLPFTVGNLIAPVYAAALAHLGLAWPTGRLRSRFEVGVVVAEYAWNIGQSLAGMLFWDPRTNCSPACPANLIMVHGSRSAENVIGLIDLPVGLVLTGIVLTLIVQHWRSARGWSRRAMLPLLWIAPAICALSAMQTVAGDLSLPFFESRTGNIILYGYAPLILLAGPALFVAGTLLARTARGAVGTAIVDLEPGAPPGRLRDTLARALGDSTLQLAFRQPGAPGYTDTEGRAVDPARPEPGRIVTPLPVSPGAAAADAVLVHDGGLEHEPQLIRLTAAAASMALEHSRLQAEVQAQLEQVRASRARIVEAGDAARRRIERDLHDGAQQRLVTLSLALGMARSQVAGSDPDLAALLDGASKETREAIAELRELARGIHPAVLTETGLAGAIQALVERSPVATTVSAVPACRYPAPIEATAYFVVCEALANVAKHAPAATARVAVWQSGERIVVEIADDGPGGAGPDAGSGLRGLADRVASVGGNLRIDSPAGAGTRLTAELPCP
jgi:signal transduction histidine kinase